MPFDGIVTRAVTEELNTLLTGGRIQKIYQPTDSEIIITVRNKGKNHSLLISNHATYARTHLTSQKFTNPKEPPMYCMVLRKYLASGYVEKVEQVEMERIIHLSVRSKDEIGDENNKKLIIEIMGKHSNAILVDPERNVILDSLKHISPAQNRHRSILPGQTYVAPPEQGKFNPVELEPSTFIKKLDFNQGKMGKQMLNLLMGCSPIVTNNLAEQAYLGSESTYKEVFEKFQSQLINHDYQPSIIKGDKEDFHVIPFSNSQDAKHFDTVNEMLDTFYYGKAERDRIKNQTYDLMRMLKNERDKNERKIKKQLTTLKKAEKADEYQKKGELLTAHMHLVNHGDSKVEVMDYYDPNQNNLSIDLNPNKTPSENAQSYFKQYQKLKKSKQVVEVEIEKAKKEIEYLERIIQQLEQAREVDVADIREELEEEGYVKQKQKGSKKKKKKMLSPDYYTSTDGTEIIVGRNNKQNEFVTTRLANKEDYWLHAKDIPGSHVLIRSNKPSEETILEAAMIGAYYSKAKLSASVPVDYTLVKHVKKPNGAKPGYVIYEQQQTVFVTPDGDKIEALHKKDTTQ
ncbi:Rqc2 family fibronectin-binding protein [Halalkalibacillus halophilus]|uniref:Rqc2 family fibronectin-binding protein n=1 Tax=Halalkalibacillus halophilus TaxID=392827 RepID=UPI00042424DB|nr:NFACT RNA binding domain-containing protein [Halalkalibacillus halophilus]